MTIRPPNFATVPGLFLFVALFMMAWLSVLLIGIPALVSAADTALCATGFILVPVVAYVAAVVLRWSVDQYIRITNLNKDNQDA